MLGKTAAEIFVEGKVQGVGFRKFTLYHADLCQVDGSVQNLSDGRVRIEVEAEKDKIERLIRRLRTGPPQSKVENIQITWKQPENRWTGFSIVRVPQG